MYEYKIAEGFSQKKEFFPEFSSCNRNFKIWKKTTPDSLWCRECEKCSFVFLILSAFLEPKELENIFWENLFEKEELEQTFRELIWLNGNKPFECVGTYEECLISAQKALKTYRQDLPIILRNIESDVIVKLKDVNLEKLENKLLKIYDDHIIPVEFYSLFTHNDN